MKVDAIIMVIIISVIFELIDWPVISEAVSRLIIKILAYSAIKIKANVDLLYSVLNPDTNSDSPSARSNGVRLVSAKFVINHRMAIGVIIIDTHDIIFIFIWLNLIDWWIRSIDSRIKDIDTSYEIVCAILRSAPNKAYLEFEHHPAIKVEYTFILDTHRKYNTLNDRIIDG
jgi:hypothetical protein